MVPTRCLMGEMARETEWDRSTLFDVTSKGTGAMGTDEGTHAVVI
jgi:hypothetical protein